MSTILAQPGRASMRRHNEGTFDRWLRVVLGAVLISLVFTGPRTPWGWLGLVPLATAMAGYCPIYALFGWSTCRRVGHHHA
jgi:hypothetical protein